MLLLPGVMLYHDAAAQESPASGNTPTFESLKLNSSPAFVMLGIEPDNIQRPSTPGKLVAGLQNAVVDGKLQPNAAFEITPYYLLAPRDTTSKRFDPVYYLLDKKNTAETMFRTLSVSLATSATDQATFGDLQAGTGAGIGLRTQIIDGKAGRRLKNWEIAQLKFAYYDKLRVLARTYSGPFDLKVVLDQAASTFMSQILPANQMDVMSDARWQKFIDQTETDLLYTMKSDGIITDKAKVVAELDKLRNDAVSNRDETLDTLNRSINPLTKEGFMLELAAGQAFVFQGNTWQDAAAAKTAIWLTPSWRINKTRPDSKKVTLYDIMLVLRYTWNNQNAKVDVANYTDGGLKGAATLGNWSGSVEYVYRNASHIPEGATKRYTYRLTVGMDYKITQNITFKFNFGSNFDGNTTTYSDPKKMFAVGGINFGVLNFTNTK